MSNLSRTRWREHVEARVPPCPFLEEAKAEYRYPADDPPWPGCEPVKRWAAKAGRARTREGRRKAEERLREVLDELDDAALSLWASATMIDQRWCGATGQGGFWARASESCNQVAARLIHERSAVRTASA